MFTKRQIEAQLRLFKGYLFGLIKLEKLLQSISITLNKFIVWENNIIDNDIYINNNFIAFPVN